MFVKLLAKMVLNIGCKSLSEHMVTALRSCCRCAAGSSVFLSKHIKIVIYNRELPRYPSLAKLGNCAAAD
jgi:hypothetical protein